MTTRPKPSYGPDTNWHHSGAMGIFKKRRTEQRSMTTHNEKSSVHDAGVRHSEGRRSRHSREHQQPQHHLQLPTYNHNGHLVTKGIQPDGESGRSWFHPWHFVRICWRSTSTLSKWTNILWPFTIAAMVMHFGYLEPLSHVEEMDEEQRELYHRYELWTFITAYIGMVPAANLVGFAGQELARKIPKVLGVLLETTFGSIVEIILFMVLLCGKPGPQIAVIRAAILGSILANLLLCLGLCFTVGGIFRPQQVFHEAISEVGSNLMLVAGLGLIIPTIFYNSLTSRYPDPTTLPALYGKTLSISRAAAIVLLFAFCVYVFFQMRSHHGLYEDILEADEERDADRHKDMQKDKLTLTECIIALGIALTFVSFMAIFLVQEIEYLVQERGVSDALIGLILVPFVEKAAEHLTAIDEAYDNQMNFALAHVLGASVQTALLNAPLVVIVGWGLDYDMSLNFELFDAVMLILAIIVVGNFLRDEKSDYLEGALCVLVYILIAVSAYYYPNPIDGEEGEGTASGEGGGAEGEVAKMLARMVMG
ncbi:hypothetical protein K431DRAFT_299682 [Polychaeton citri CBS 116435]|uniref:Vacuolar calcium ion transporter n=1 Tax=Polychaeton citri CBS 116435 TaxID=1314669 RepID=A0A9P4UUP0_9PEZI|nr:hypothetical protein K431DRAFT_299682 [Polychaeton citri CBS 116435]